MDSAILHPLQAERGPQSTGDDVASTTFPSIIRLCSPMPHGAHICLPYAERKCPKASGDCRAQSPDDVAIRCAFLRVRNGCFPSSKAGLTVVHCRQRSERVGKEVTDMVSLELIGVLGALFVFLVLALVRTQLARREVKARQRAEGGAPKQAEETR